MLGRNFAETFATSSHTVSLPSRREMDCLDYSQVKGFIENGSFDLVINCAGKVGGISENIKNPHLYFFENLQIGLNVLRACSESQVTKVLNIGTANSFPFLDGQQSVSERNLLEGCIEPSVEPYGIAKGAVAKYANYLSDAKGYDYKTLFLTNIFGKYDSFGSKAHMLPAIIARLHIAKINGTKAVEIWGDGTARRSFIYASDVCQFVSGLVADYDKMPRAYLMLGEKSHSVLEYNKAVAKVVGFEGEFIFNLSRPTGALDRNLSTDYPQLYTHDYTPLELAISEVYKHYLLEVYNEC